MKSFRTEIENPVVEKEIIELERKIYEFQNGQVHDDRFRSLRLARGIYGQRQPGVQMIRIKLPFGKVSFEQLLKIADVSDEYSTGNLHLTTRQDIQLHYVSLDRTPQLWADLAQDDMTLREACGNTVRNITGSPLAGIDPDEPFDVSPYIQETFEYLVRNPICQEMGRKFKISFSSSDKDTAYSFMHDLGFIPKVRLVNGKEERGFRVMIGGGLGAQPMVSQLASDFIHEDDLIPYVESVVRVFDRVGERNNRNKARFKFVLQKIGLEALLDLIREEFIAVKNKKYKINREKVLQVAPPVVLTEMVSKEPTNLKKFNDWFVTNVFEQKQKGYFGVYLKVQTGDIHSDTVRRLYDLLQSLVANEIRITQNQGMLLKFVPKTHLVEVFNRLDSLGLADAGFDSVGDVTTCPGTDTCNLGITNSTEMARVIESFILDKYPDLIFDPHLKIKISGCMNSCGQHGLAHIGIHGSSVRVNNVVVPAAQIMLGGSNLENGAGRMAERVIKIPTKRITLALDELIKDFLANKLLGEFFHDYYERQGKNYFYQLLKDYGDTSNLESDDFIDWGHESEYEQAIGVGECAGVVIDLVTTLLYEAEEKIGWAKESFKAGVWADSIYHTYSAFINIAKAMLLQIDVNSSTQVAVIRDFDKFYVESGEISLDRSFHETVMQINQNEPTKSFARSYIDCFQKFTKKTIEYLNQLKTHISYEKIT